MLFAKTLAILTVRNDSHQFVLLTPVT